MPRVGLRRKKTRTHTEDAVGEAEKENVPRSFVVRRGRVSGSTRDLVNDLRDVMAPNCAKALKEKQSTKVKDYLAVTNVFGVSHLVMLSNNATSTYLRIARVPQGPTVTFKVNKFTLSRDIQATQKRPHKSINDLRHAPLLLMNNFGGQEHDTKLMAEVLKNMFPPINVETFTTNNCRRTALFHLEKNGAIQFRHYAITQKLHGVSRSIQRLVNGKACLGSGQDVADYILGGGYASDSEMEDDVPAQVRPDKKKASQTVGLNLVEIGPRMELIPVKAEAGVMDGSVLFHKYIKKTPEEQMASDLKIKARMAQKEKREKEEIREMVKKAELRKKKQKKDQLKREKNMPQLSDDESSVRVAPPEKSDDKKLEGEEVLPSKRKRFNPLYKKRKDKKGGDGADTTHHKNRKSKGHGKVVPGANFKKKPVKKGGKKRQ